MSTFTLMTESQIRPEPAGVHTRLREAAQPAGIVTPAAVPVSEDGFTLDKLPARRRAVILALKDEFAYLYLLRLGLVVGAEVELVRSVSRGSIRIFRVDSGELALRSDAASGITVRLLSREEWDRE